MGTVCVSVGVLVRWYEVVGAVLLLAVVWVNTSLSTCPVCTSQEFIWCPDYGGTLDGTNSVCGGEGLQQAGTGGG